MDSLSIFNRNARAYDFPFALIDELYSGISTCILRRMGSKFEVYIGFTIVLPFNW